MDRAISSRSAGSSALVALRKRYLLLALFTDVRLIIT